MILTVFRSRVRQEHLAEYMALAPRMIELATSMPGYRSHKAFAAEDGEHVIVIEFEDAAAQENWSKNLEHVAAKQEGRRAFYSEYSIQVCEVLRESRFKME